MCGASVCPYVQSRSGEEDVCGLGHVGRVQAVVVRHVGMVVVLQGHHVGHKGIHGDLKCLHQVPLLGDTKQNTMSSCGFSPCCIILLHLKVCVICLDDGMLECDLGLT